MMACQYYREKKKVYVSIGILYNHESSFRAKNFVSRKIISAAAQIAQAGKGYLKLGNLYAEVDWGYAPDYVDAMHRILTLDEPNDFIIATGESHSVKEFSEIAFNYFGLDYSKYIQTDKSVLTRENLTRIGDSSLLREKTGWSPTISFAAMIREMAKEEAEFINEE
jgi:GDPmannose 4,6-dehydratase